MSKIDNKTVEDEIEDDLTDEERAAIAGEDEDEGEAADPAADGGEGEDQGGEGESEKDEAAVGQDGEDEPDSQGDEGGSIVRAEAAPLKYALPADAAERASALEAEETALEAKFEEGELTGAEYRKGLNEIADKRSQLRWEQQRAELAADMTQQAEANAWARDVQDFMRTTGASILASKPLIAAFDHFVREVSGDAAFAGLSNRAQLEKAHELFAADLAKAGVVLPNAAAKPKAAEPEPPSKEAAVKAAAAAVRKLPPTLGKVPQSDIPDTDQGKYAAIDRIKDPDAYEAEIARLQDRGEFDAYANA